MEVKPGWNELGRSNEDRPIRAFSNAHLSAPSSGNWTLLLGGTHGDELAAVSFLEYFQEVMADMAPSLGPTVVLPALNPDGLFRVSRYNARGVDLNRNLPAGWSAESVEPSGSEPLSEPETRLLHDLVTRLRPSRIVSLHWALGELDPDGSQSASLARAMFESLSQSERRLFRLREPSGSCWPGSLGSFCLGLDPAPALVTLELPYHPEPDAEGPPENHLRLVHEFWREQRDRYHQAVYPAVEAMLRAAAKG